MVGAVHVAQATCTAADVMPMKASATLKSHSVMNCPPDPRCPARARSTWVESTAVNVALAHGAGPFGLFPEKTKFKSKEVAASALIAKVPQANAANRPI